MHNASKDKGWSDIGDSVCRAISIGVAGYLIGGWRGAIAGIAILWVAVQLVQDHLNGIKDLHEIDKTNKK